jgi:uncharacterized membrane protein YsdA (DUF1294 family)
VSVARTLVTAFVAFLVVLIIMGQMPVMVLGIYLVCSLITYAMYSADKAAARRGRWRTKESTLHLLSLIGGWPGALVAQYHLRHKSRKAPFRVAFAATVVLNTAALIWFIATSGSRVHVSLLSLLH